MVVDQPLAAALGLGHLLGRYAAGGSCVSYVGELAAAARIFGPVLDGRADVGQHAAERSPRSVQLGAGRDAVDLDVDPRLVRRLPPGSLERASRTSMEVAGDVRVHRELRVHDEVDATVPSCASSAVTESTRNGMSSVTTSTTVCGDVQPCSSTVGVNTRTRAVPCGRFAASSRCEHAAPATSTGSRSDEVLGGDAAVVAVEERGVLQDRRARQGRSLRGRAAPTWRRRAC